MLYQVAMTVRRMTFHGLCHREANGHRVLVAPGRGPGGSVLTSDRRHHTAQYMSGTTRNSVSVYNWVTRDVHSPPVRRAVAGNEFTRTPENPVRSRSSAATDLWNLSGGW